MTENAKAWLMFVAWWAVWGGALATTLHYAEVIDNCCH